MLLPVIHTNSSMWGNKKPVLPDLMGVKQVGEARFHFIRKHKPLVSDDCPVSENRLECSKFYVVTLCEIVGRYRSFVAIKCLHFQG